MRVKLSASVVGSHVQLGLVKERNDLEVGGGLEELDTGDGTLGNETSTTAGLGTPSDLVGL